MKMYSGEIYKDKNIKMAVDISNQHCHQYQQHHRHQHQQQYHHHHQQNHHHEHHDYHQHEQHYPQKILNNYNIYYKDHLYHKNNKNNDHHSTQELFQFPIDSSQINNNSQNIDNNSNNNNKNNNNNNNIDNDNINVTSYNIKNSDNIYCYARNNNKNNNNNLQIDSNNFSKKCQNIGKYLVSSLNILNYKSHVTFLLTLYLILSWNQCNSFVLDGSQNSFAQFRKWYTGLNGSLEFEFKTEQPNGLIVYTDDGGTFDFFEVKLVEGAVRLRYNLGGGANIITVGRELYDGHWHKVQIQRNEERTTLTVDGVSQTKISRGKEFHFGKFASNSDVFVGGMPIWYNAKLTLLALPSVVYEPRFRGSIRNLVYADQPSIAPRRQEMRQNRELKCGDAPCDQTELPRDKVTRGLRSNVTDACERHDPCQHGGICISTDSGPLCECRNLEYEGTYCERDKAPSEATFRGTEFLSYDLGLTGAEPIVSAQDAISLLFRTRQPNGLLFYTGHGTDYLNLALKDGGVSLTMGLANGKQEMHIKPARIRFDDHQWHKVTVHRRIQEISALTSFCRLVAVVDDVYTDHSHIAGKFTMLSSSRVYVGGSVNTRALQGARVHNNFVGCLRKVEFSADTLRLNLIDLARTGSKLIQVAGRMEYACPAGDPQDPVTFTTRDSHLILPPWDTGKQSLISFKFRTNEPNGLILMTMGTKTPKTDLFAIELLNGHIYIHVDLGSGAAKVRASRKRVDDGTWHELTLRRTGREGKVSIDQQWNDFRTPGDSTQLELDGPLFIGGTGSAYGNLQSPASIWTATLRQGFVGCLRDLQLSGKPVDIAAFARQQDTGAVKPSCHLQSNQCGTGALSPCQNNGVCTEGWNRPLCDCSSTLYAGPTCGRESATLAFNGSQHMTIWVGGAQGTRTQTEELVLRFKTARAGGLLLVTSADSNSPDRLEISLVVGRVRASVRLGEREKHLLAGQGVLNDNNWHTIRFSRRASNLRLQVDGASPVRADTILGRHSAMEIRSIHLGGLFHAEEEIQMTSTMANFVGQMQGFIYNGWRYIDLVKSLGPELSALSMTTFKLTARFISSPPGQPYHAATFRSRHSYVGLAMLKAYNNVLIDFRFKTVEANGLLFYNAGRRTDFIAVELVNGHIHYIFDLGDGPITLRDKSHIHMNDNRWHSVSIRRPGPKTHTLVVDDTIEVYNAPGNNMHMELDGILYVGGVFKDMYTKLPSTIASRNGYEGCLASMDLADVSPNLIDDAVVPSSLVMNGCEGPTKCSQNACANRGVCVQQWNTYACECDMTSYTGPTCYDESVAYEFGANKGVIQYTFPPGGQPETEEDSIALGFITVKSDAVLLRIESSSTQDYMELEIVEGNIFMVYNVGSHDLPLGEIGTKVNDNTYHVVRFQRFGGNATLQLDDYNVQTVYPQGHQSTTFNAMANIQIGGKLGRNGRFRVERSFAGVIAGVSINRLRILDLAAERDPHISIRGEVQLVTGVLDRNDLQRMQQTPPSSYSGVMDDLIFSGAGSGCRGDDEDECTPPFESGSGDDLITPVYIPPTKQPTTPQKGDKDATGTERTCDDEDCVHGSGDSGEVTESFTPTTIKGSETTDHISSTIPDTTKHIHGTSDQEMIDTTIDLTNTTPFRISNASGGSSSSSGIGVSTTVGSSSTGSTGTGHSRTTPSISIISSSSPSGSSTSGTSSIGTTSHDRDHETTIPDHEYTYPHYTPITPETDILQNENEQTISPPIVDPPVVPVETEAPTFTHQTQPPPTYRPPKNKNRVTTEAEERTAMIIGIVAGALIAVILVILLLLWLKSNGDRTYKTEMDKNFGQGPSAALLGGSHSSNHHQQQQQQQQQQQHHNQSQSQRSNYQDQQQQQHHHQPQQHHLQQSHHQNHQMNGSSGPLNGSLRNGTDKGQMGIMGGVGMVPPKPKKRDSKDIKEWYV